MEQKYKIWGGEYTRSEMIYKTFSFLGEIRKAEEETRGHVQILSEQSHHGLSRRGKADLRDEEDPLRAAGIQAAGIFSGSRRPEDAQRKDHLARAEL